MPDHLLQPAEVRRGHRRDAFGVGDLTAEGALRSRFRHLSAFPALTVIGVWMAVGTARAFLNYPTGWALAVATVGSGVTVVVGDRHARRLANGIREAADRRVREQVNEELRRQRAEDQQQVLGWLQQLHASAAEGHKAVLYSLDQLARGETPLTPPACEPTQPPGGDPFGGFADALARMHSEALEAVAAFAARQHVAALEAEQAEVFVYIARRLHALVSRTLAALTAIENSLEDPDLLHSLFTIDHLVTQTRRAVESLAVLGGETPRRVIKPLLLSTVLRQAVAEIEQYPRVRVVFPRQEVALPGHAGPDVIHLLAELVENGTKFSPSSTQVVMHAEPVSAGMVIEVQDRGLSMSPERLSHLNRLLASPAEADLGAQLRDGHIGLLVAARLASRHGIRVELRRNIVGGTQALVVVPHKLLVPAREVAPTTGPAGKLPATTVAAAASTLPSRRPVTAEDPATPAETGSSARAIPALPQRRRRTAPAPTSVARSDSSSTAPPGSVPDGRPALPRRSEAGIQVDAPGGVRAQGPSGPASAGLMARYAAGVRRGAHGDGAEPPPSPKTTH